MRGEILVITIVSAAAGCASAVLYHVFAGRMHLLVATRPGRLLPLLAVLSMLLRLVMVGFVILVIHLFTPLNPVATSVAFVALFTVLTGLSLYRFAQGSGLATSMDLKR